MLSEAELRGYRDPAEGRRYRARLAGLASGRARRDRAHGRKVGHRRSSGEALAQIYPPQRWNRSDFEQVYRELLGVRFHQAGFETAWTLYRANRAGYDCKGQNFLTTNGQMAAALGARGRPRSSRTVQRARKRISAMVRYSHVRRGGAQRGKRDVLRVCLLPKMSPRLRQQEQRAFGPSAAPASAPAAPDTGACGARERPPNGSPVPPIEVLRASERQALREGGSELPPRWSSGIPADPEAERAFDELVALKLSGRRRGHG